MFTTTPYITAREPRNDVSRLQTSYPLDLCERVLSHQKPKSSETSGKSQRDGAILKMQRLIVALCLSAAAALVPNSASARSNSNAKAPLKVGLPASVAR